MTTEDPRRIEFRNLIEVFHKAWETNVAVEEADAALDRFADDLFATPVHAIADIVLRADVAEYWMIRAGGDATTDRYQCELINAVRSIAELEELPWSRPFYAPASSHSRTAM